jgi:hypothetical protein
MILTESQVQALARVEASEAGCRIWRNNVGVAVDHAGRPVRYGLANESAQINRVLKSSDLIGIKPLLILPEHVGSTLGIFLARECKGSEWRYMHTAREQAQKKFIDLVNSLGGDAAFLTGPGTF